jgi:hypothetical protein
MSLQHALARLASGMYGLIDLDRISVFGLSKWRRIFAAGSSRSSGARRTWYEHMLDLERRRLIEEKKSPAELLHSILSGTACGTTRRMADMAAPHLFINNCKN